MFITKISIKNLFGLFDHTIVMNRDEKVTVIIGPNGIGKTILFTMIHGLYNHDYHIFQQIPFAEFEIIYDDESWLQVKRSKTDGEDSPVIFCDYKLKDQSNSASFKLFSIQEDENLRQIRVNVVRYLQNKIPGLRYVDSDTWIFKPKGESNEEVLSSLKVSERFGNRLPLSARQDLLRLSNEVPEGFKFLTSAFTVRFISTQRLHTWSKSENEERSYITKTKPELVVDTFSKELMGRILQKSREYAEISQAVDPTFVNRLILEVGDLPESQVDETFLDVQLKALQEKQSWLRNIGLLSEGQEISWSADLRDKARQDVLVSVMTLSIKDNLQKLEVYDDLAKKIELLLKIINERDQFLYKTMKVDSSQGIVFVNKNGIVLKPQDLSSGEQHEVVLNYELLFNVLPNSLILIDEPELSLHIAWQKSILEDFLRIAQLGNFNIMLATHSPDIIRDRWDLAVDLGGAAI